MHSGRMTPRCSATEDSQPARRTNGDYAQPISHGRCAEALPFNCVGSPEERVLIAVAGTVEVGLPGVDLGVALDLQ